MSNNKLSFRRLFASLPLVFHRKSLLAGVNVPDQLEPSEPDPSLPVDYDSQPGDILDLLPRLQESHSACWGWLEQGAFEAVGQFPVNGGGIAEVWEGRMGDRKVAIKSYRCYSSSDCSLTYVRFYKEAITGSHLKHQNIVSFIGMCSTTEHPLALIFDFMDNFDFAVYLRNNGNVRRVALLSDIAHGVKYIHELNVVHGNLNILNIVVGSDGRARVAGLGAAYISSLVPELDTDRFSEVHGAAPDVANPHRFGLRNARATKESDIHAFGALAYEVFAGEAPMFEEDKLTGVRSNFFRRRSARPSHPELSDRVWEVIRGCLKKVPSQRKTIIQAVAVLDVELNSY